VEFAFIALVLYLLLAAIIDFGRGMFGAQVLQQAADATARELSRTPMPPTGTLTGPTGMFATNANAQQIYSENFLVVPLSTIGSQAVTDYFAQNAPLLNQLLLPLMVVTTPQELNNQQVLQYPGALVASPATPTGYTVQIPIVTYTAGSGLTNPSTETLVKMIPVVEEVTPNPADNPFAPDPAWSPFNLLAANLAPGQRGVIALRINYPFQAAAFSAYTQDPATGAQAPVVVSPSGSSYGPYAGSDGLGQQAALGTTVRPFRRVLSAQAVFRREIFE
jgi:Flp pilus assembly protein TadG